MGPIDYATPINHLINTALSQWNTSNERVNIQFDYKNGAYVSNQFITSSGDFLPKLRAVLSTFGIEPQAAHSHIKNRVTRESFTISEEQMLRAYTQFNERAVSQLNAISSETTWEFDAKDGNFLPEFMTESKAEALQKSLSNAGINATPISVQDDFKSCTPFARNLEPQERERLLLGVADRRGIELSDEAMATTYSVRVSQLQVARLLASQLERPATERSEGHAR